MERNKQELVASSRHTIEAIYDHVYNGAEVSINDFDVKKTALVIVDMVNGFAREGALKSDRVEGIIGEVAVLSEAFGNRGMKKLAFGDCHLQDSHEFTSYPPHCISGTSEAEIVDELKMIGGYTYFTKNSTNGFLEEEFQNWLIDNSRINCFIIVGDCTDICIQQFATTIKTWFNMHDRASRIIVPANAVETFDLGLHEAGFINLMALYFMKENGIEIVEKVRME